MLFNSYIFILLFLPITLFGFYMIGGRGHHRIAISWLVAASLVFYGYWNPAYLGLILGSMIFNYAVGIALSSRDVSRPGMLLFLGIFANLALLGYFKYANFFVDSVNHLFKESWHLETIILPLAISFFTFQQIAFLVDARRQETRELNFLHYALFVTFFPQLIAGPIVHHKEMLPQFAKNEIYRFCHSSFAIGVSIFAIGLFKKVVIADGIAEYSSPVFAAAERPGETLSFLEAWGGALGYTFQIYFDFSGYSDMAIGLARMFGVQLPVNFFSPYKARSIIEFWRRWHMTLSRFLRDYLYIPLGGSRCGPIRRYANLMITMLLGGLWHGAGWTFVVWGGLHGFYLMVNHAWHRVEARLGEMPFTVRFLGRQVGYFLTFLAFVVAWVVFRAESMDGANSILSAMAGSNGIVLPSWWVYHLPFLEYFVETSSRDGELFGQFGDVSGYTFIVFLFLWVWLLPNTSQLFFDQRNTQYGVPVLVHKRKYKWWQWQPHITWAVITALLLFFSGLHMSRVSEFLYFQF